MLRCTFLIFALSLATLGCQQLKSANPLGPDVAGPISGVQITAPQLLEPNSGATLTGHTTNISLVVQNAQTSGERPLWLQLDLSTDAGFQQILHQADRLTPGGDGRTTYRLPEALAAGRTYYWRARALDGANSGPYSDVAHFSVVDPVIIETPVPLEPLGLIATNRPEFKVRNGAVSGPAGGVVYRFEVATAPDVLAITAVVTVAAGSGGTTSMSLGELPYGRTLYWRVYATDHETTSDYSQAVWFRTPDAPSPTPGPTPTPQPVPGGSVGGARTISPEEALSIIEGVHDAERWDLGSRSSREQRVQFLFKAVAAVHYGHSRYNPKGPDSNWCVKDAGGGRPPSDDVIVRCNTREAWDLIGGAGADGYRFHLDYIGRLGFDQNVYPPPR